MELFRGDLTVICVFCSLFLRSLVMVNCASFIASMNWCLNFPCCSLHRLQALLEVLLMQRPVKVLVYGLTAHGLNTA